MNILELCFSNAWGGLEIYVGNYAREFSKVNQFVTTVTLSNSRLQTDLRKSGIKNISIKPLLKYLDFISAIKIRNSIKEKIDIIHVHQSRDLSTAILLKMLCKDSKLVYSQQMDSRFNKKDLYHKWIYKNIDYVVTMTDDMRTNHINNTPVSPDLIKTVYNGIDLSKFIIKNENDINLSVDLKLTIENKVVIGCVARLDSLKNQEILIDVAKFLIEEQITNFHFMIIGDETDSISGRGYKQKLLDLIQQFNLQSYFTFISFTNNIENYFSIMDIFVLPTNKESFGYVLIEAMAIGKPVIASNQGGPKEIIQQNVNGFLFESKNYLDLAGKIKILIKNESIRLKMGEESKRIAISKFDIKTTIKNYLELFSLLIAKKH